MQEIDNVLNELYRFSPEILTLGDPLKNFSLIDDFEIKHNVKLPLDFKYLLSKHNGIDLMGVNVYGFQGAENLESVYNFEHYKVKYPQFNYIVPFSPDGGGNFYCFDTRIHKGNTCNIVFWTSNYVYSEEDQPEIVNSSFSDWIKQVMIEWTLESYDYQGDEK